MPREAYEIIVSKSGSLPEPVAVAQAMRSLCRSDKTESIVAGAVFDVNVYGGDDGQDYGIGICVNASLATDHPDNYADAYAQFDDVESVERVYHEMV